MLNAAGPLTAVINLSGHPRVTLFDNALVFGANLALCIVLVPRYGMAGAAASTLIALCSVTLLQVGQVARLFRIHPFRDDQLRCLAAGGVAALATAALTLLPWPAPLLRGRRWAVSVRRRSTSRASPRWACARRRENSRYEREIAFCAGSRPGRTHGWDS